MVDLGRGGMHGCSGEGGMRGCSGGVCMVARGACVVALGGCAWLLRGCAWLLRGDMHHCLGGHAWLLWGGMRGCSGGRHAWLLWGSVYGCSGGACVVALGEACDVTLGGHVWLPRGACVVTLGGHAWLLRGRVWRRGVCMVKGACGKGWGVRGMHPPRYDRSLRGRYASYWNALLLKINPLLRPIHNTPIEV